MRTLAAALAATMYSGTLVMLAGDYAGDSLNLATAKTVTVRGQGAVNVLLGEKVDTFTLHSGTTWKVDIATVIPGSMPEHEFVFEWGTPEGLLDATNAPFAPAGRTHRLQHYRMRVGLGAGNLAPGEYFFDEPTLYIRRTDDTNPNGKAHWVPNQSGASFLYNGTSATNASVSGVNVFFGFDGVTMSGVASYALTGCLFFGNANEGVVYNDAGATATETDCEYAANANDGRGITCSLAGNPIVSTVTRPWAHDNHDEGVSDHNVGSFSTYLGGLYEYNESSGSTWVQGAPVVFTNPHTRYNTIGLAAAINQTVGTITGWLSEYDTYAASATSNSTLTFTNSTILAPVTAALLAGLAGDVINASNISGVTTPRSGGGTFNVT